MKSFQLLITLFAFTLLSSATIAAQVTVEDISNQSSYCGNGTGNLKLGECLTVPNGVLQVTVKLEANEKPEVLDNIHVVIENKGQYFQYLSQARTNNAGNRIKWEPISIKGLMTSAPLMASFHRFPFQTTETIQEVYLGDEVYAQKGTKVYVGVRANDTAGFMNGSVKEAFVIR